MPVPHRNAMRGDVGRLAPARNIKPDYAGPHSRIARTVALSPGARLGPYEITAQIGVGGMGEVYRAKDTRLPREAAIKVSAERFSERFAGEAQIIASLNHPNISTLYDVGDDYLVMELVEGPTLAEKISTAAADARRGIGHRATDR